MSKLLPGLCALALLPIVGCGDDSGPNTPDAAGSDAAVARDAGPRDAGPSDAGASDAGPSDAGPADAGAPVVCDESFIVTDDSTTVGNFDVVISEISMAGDYVELANITGADVTLSALTTHQWCSFPSYTAVSAGSVVVPAGGFATIPFPTSGQSEAAGELVLYVDGMFGSPDSVLDYVCWGAGGTMRKAVAETAGKWSGPCADAIPPGGALHRSVDEEGIDSSDYSADATQTPLNCVGP